MLHAFPLPHKVTMREHDAFRNASSTRSVNNCGTVHLIHFSLTFLYFFRMRMFSSELNKSVKIAVFTSVDESVYLL